MKITSMLVTTVLLAGVLAGCASTSTGVPAADPDPADTACPPFAERLFEVRTALYGKEAPSESFAYEVVEVSSLDLPPRIREELAEPTCAFREGRDGGRELYYFARSMDQVRATIQALSADGVPGYYWLILPQGFSGSVMFDPAESTTLPDANSPPPPVVPSCGQEFLEAEMSESVDIAALPIPALLEARDLLCGASAQDGNRIRLYFAGPAVDVAPILESEGFRYAEDLDEVFRKGEVDVSIRPFRNVYTDLPEKPGRPLPANLDPDDATVVTIFIT